MSFDKLIYEASASFFYGLMSFGERWGLGMVPLVSLKEVLNENYLR